MNNKQQQPVSNKKFFMRYASLGSQLLAAIGLSVFAGLKLDGWLHTSPLLACLLPLLVLSLIFFKLYKETNSKESK